MTNQNELSGKTELKVLEWNIHGKSGPDKNNTPPNLYQTETFIKEVSEMTNSIDHSQTVCSSLKDRCGLLIKEFRSKKDNNNFLTDCKIARLGSGSGITSYLRWIRLQKTSFPKRGYFILPWFKCSCWCDKCYLSVCELDVDTITNNWHPRVKAPHSYKGWTISQCKLPSRRWGVFEQKKRYVMLRRDNFCEDYKELAGLAAKIIQFDKMSFLHYN
jgi:hypothetical protein